MLNKKCCFLAIGCLSVLASSTQASLVERDLTDHANSSLNGSGHLTFDSASGLEWLDWTLTTDRSFADVSSQFGPSGDFAGFRYATDAEVEFLISSVGADPERYPRTVELTTEHYDQLTSLLGETRHLHSTVGLTGADEGLPSGIWIRQLSDPPATIEKTVLFFDTTDFSTTVGHALVRSAAIVAVPEVGQVTCFGAVAFLLACFGRRRIVNAIA